MTWLRIPDHDENRERLAMTWEEYCDSLEDEIVQREHDIDPTTYVVKMEPISRTEGVFIDKAQYDRLQALADLFDWMGNHPEYLFSFDDDYSNCWGWLRTTDRVHRGYFISLHDAVVNAKARALQEDG